MHSPRLGELKAGAKSLVTCKACSEVDVDLASKAYLLVVPLIIGLAFIEGYPLLYSFWLSITTFEAGAPTKFVGAENYVTVLTDPLFWNSVGVSILFTLGSVFFTFLIGLIFALILREEFKGRKYLEMIYLVPIGLAPIVVGLLWSPVALWDDINVFLIFTLGLPALDVTQPLVFFPIMTMSDAWHWAPLTMLAILAVFDSMPKSLFEAAEVFGASYWHNLRKVLLPTILRSRIVAAVLILRFVDAMNAFEVPFAWTFWVQQEQLGSPADTLTLFLFKYLLLPELETPIPYISTVAILLLVVTFVGAVAFWRAFAGRE